MNSTLYEEWVRLGFSQQEAQNLVILSMYIDPFDPVEIDEATLKIIEKFNEIGCTSFWMRPEDIARLKGIDNAVGD